MNGKILATKQPSGTILLTKVITKAENSIEKVQFHSASDKRQQPCPEKQIGVDNVFGKFDFDMCLSV